MNRKNSYIPNLDKIEIDITYDCNLGCPGCDRSCSQAPEVKHIDMADIQRFIDETEAIGKVWKSVHVLGGEPTRHPKFLKILGLLDSWFSKYSPAIELKVISNGYGREVQDLLGRLPDRWLHSRSFKLPGETEGYFEAFNIAPIDLPKWRGENFSKGCWITAYCGIGLTPQGYFPCAVSGSIERIMSIRAGLNHIPQDNNEMKDMLKVFCRYCGHFFKDNYQPRDERNSKDPSHMSESWRNAYSLWRESKR